MQPSPSEGRARHKKPMPEVPLPKYVIQVQSRGRVYFYFQANRGTPLVGPRIRLSDPRDVSQLKAAYKASGIRYVEPTETFELQLASCLLNAFNRSKRYNRPFDIDIDFMRRMLEDQGGCCAVSGIPFDHKPYEDYKVAPFGISLDRISSRGGYTRCNVRLVSRIANFAMNQWGIAPLERLVEGINRERKKRKQDSICKTLETLQ